MMCAHTTNSPVNFDHLFPDVRETGETRLKQCQLVMLRMLKIVDYLCTKHEVPYFLAAGTLLGAVRHKGFIPWDDDMDLGMTRANFEKFVKLVVPHLPYDLFFQNAETDPLYPAKHSVEAKIRDRYSSYSRTEDLEEQFKWHNGIQIDILVFDRAFLPHNYFIYQLNSRIRRLPATGFATKRAKILKTIAAYSPFPLVYASGFIHKRSMVKMGANYLRESELAPYERMVFEDLEASVPHGWRAYLKRKYGNYMKLPPLVSQKGHHSVELPDPFTPCDHPESLDWNLRD